MSHKKCKLSKNYDDYCIFSNLRKQCKTLSIQCNNNYIIKIENDVVKNIKPFWNYINSLNNNKSMLPDSFVYNDISSVNNKDSAALFNDYFSSVYEEDNDNIDYTKFPASNFINNSNLDISSCKILEGEINDYLSSLSIYGGVGLDNIPPL